MATITKTAGTNILAIQQVASNAVVVGAAQDVSTKLAASVFIHLGRDDTGGTLTEGVGVRVEGSALSSGNSQWFTLAAFKSATATPEAEAVSGTVAAGATAITVASTTNLVVGDKILAKNTTIANSEFCQIKSVTANTSVTVIDALTNAQTGATLYDQAEFYAAPNIDLTAISRIRVVIDGSNTGRTVVAEAYMVTGDSIG